MPTDDPDKRPFTIALIVVLALIGALSLLAKFGLIGEPPQKSQEASAEPWPSDIPTDPPLFPQTRDLMRQGEQAQRDGRLPAARSYFVAAWELQKDCFTCYLRMQQVENVIVGMVEQALREGHAFLEEGRYADAVEKYELVRNLVPDPTASYHMMAVDGLRLARQGLAARLPKKTPPATPPPKPKSNR